jgi:hypothetical protein
LIRASVETFQARMRCALSIFGALAVLLAVDCPLPLNTLAAIRPEAILAATLQTRVAGMPMP